MYLNTASVIVILGLILGILLRHLYLNTASVIVIPVHLVSSVSVIRGFKYSFCYCYSLDPLRL